jgi:hypothetical protein
MKTAEQYKENSLGENVLLFNQRSGGGTTGGNWLGNMKRGSVFLYRPINASKTIDLTEGHVQFKSDKATMLFIRRPDDPSKGLYSWAHNVNFSDGMELIEILQEGTDEEPTEETTKED